MSRPEKFDALAVRKREMVDRAAALHFPNYDASGAELIIGAGRFVAPKTLEVQLDDGLAGNPPLQAIR
jgi:pyruvate/2-oxoglutarate dehydrogenase complex dihydrolipoamide dehydrogenase (E3) component